MKTIISKNEEKNTVEAVDWLENIVRESAGFSIVCYAAE